MADLDPITAAALCRSLRRVLTVETGMPVTCLDISAKSERWDIEACDPAGNLLRRVSYTQTVPQRMAMAGAELRDVRASIDESLADLGITGVGLSFHGRELPKSRQARQALGREVAQRVRRLRNTGQAIIEDPVAAIMAGRHPYEDTVAGALADVSVTPIGSDLPAKVLVSGDDRLMHRFPALYEEVLPAIAEKKIRHKELTSELTLVVEPVIASITRLAVREMAQRLEPGHLGFKSVYAGKLRDGRLPLKRVY